MTRSKTMKVVLPVEPVLKVDHLARVVKVVVLPVVLGVEPVLKADHQARVIKAVVHPGVVGVAVGLPIVADAVVVPMAVDVVVVLPRMVDVVAVLLIAAVVDAILRTMEGVVLRDVEVEGYSVLAKRTWLVVKMLRLSFARQVATEVLEVIFNPWT